MKANRPVVVGIFVFILCFALLGFKQAQNPAKKAVQVSTITHPTFLVVSDIHLCDDCVQGGIKDTKKHSDSGVDLWKSAKEKIAEVVNGPDAPKFILVLGDLVRHFAKKDDRSPDIVLRDITTVLTDLRKIAESKNIPLIYLPGNNDSPLKNYGPFSEDVLKAFYQSKNCWPKVGSDFSKLSSNTGVIGAGANPDKGYYACETVQGGYGGYMIIAMNTVMFTDTAIMQENEQQLHWLDTTLSANESRWGAIPVLIAMHVPPKDFKGHLKDEFLEIVKRHPGTIRSVLASHTHMDGIKLLEDNCNNFINLLVSVPGIAPGHGNNPGFDLVTYNPNTFELEDFKTYYMDYEEGGKVDKWGNLSLKFSDVFQCSNCTSMRDYVKNHADKDSVYESKLFNMENQRQAVIEIPDYLITAEDSPCNRK